jgi:hypothetical protein
MVKERRFPRRVSSLELLELQPLRELEKMQALFQ